MDENSITQAQNVSLPEPQIDTREIILQLKAALKSKGLGVQDVIEMYAGKPGMPSESSIKRVFAPGSENKTFNYRLTLKPLIRELLDIKPEALAVPPSASEQEHEIAALKSVIFAKVDLCNQLEEQNRELTAKLEKSESEREKQAELFMKRIEKLDHLLEKAEGDIGKNRLKLEKVARARRFWTFTTFLVLIAFIIYLIIHDIPNPEYGIFSFDFFVKEVKAIFGGTHTAGSLSQVAQWVQV